MKAGIISKRLLATETFEEENQDYLSILEASGPTPTSLPTQDNHLSQPVPSKPLPLIPVCPQMF